MQFSVSKRGRMLVNMEVMSTFLYQIKARQFEDVKLNKIKNKVVCGESPDAIFDTCGVLRVRVCM